MCHYSLMITRYIYMLNRKFIHRRNKKRGFEGEENLFYQALSFLLPKHLQGKRAKITENVKIIKKNDCIWNLNEELIWIKRNINKHLPKPQKLIEGKNIYLRNWMINCLLKQIKSLRILLCFVKSRCSPFRVLQGCSRIKNDIFVG